MVKLSILLKGIVLYVIFVIGMSILLEYFGSGNKSHIDTKIDEILDSIKNDIKSEFINKAKEHFDAVIGKPRPPLGMGYAPQYQNNQRLPEPIRQESEEEKIIKAVNDRLKYSNMNFDNQTYTNLNNQNYIPLATTNDFSYTPVDYNWDTNGLSHPTKEPLPKHNSVNIGNYKYQIPQTKFNQGFELLPEKLGIDPSTYHS